MSTVMGKMEKVAVGLAQRLLCPMFLGQDWPYFHKVIDQALGHRAVHIWKKTIQETQEEGLTGDEPASGIEEKQQQERLMQRVNSGMNKPENPLFAMFIRWG